MSMRASSTHRLVSLSKFSNNSTSFACIIQAMLDAVSNQEKISRLKEMLRENASPNKQTQKEVFPQTKAASRKPQSSLLPLEQRYLELEDKFKTRLEQEWRMLEDVALEVETLQEQARILRKEVDRSRENANQRASTLQREITEEVAEQCEDVRGVRKDLLEGLEKKYRTIKTETMAVLGNQFEIGWDEARDQILGEIENARDKMEHEEAARDEIVTFMVTNFGEEILKAEQMVQKQREERTQSHRRLISSIASVEEQSMNSILLQRKEAGMAIQTLQGYLQELCFKIQSNILG